ncbi:MAG: EAL domain-containing protein [Gammaproteobacteria bacterium]|nr:EAL domain-containing protein [Gammaproteobacteria bacterium]MCW9003861.1 EAL domain-containing protein [Gammaproteobacteria bacterium]
MDQRRIINGSLIVLSLIVACLAGQWGWTTYFEYRAAKDMTLVNQLVDDLIRASNIEAVERGMTSLLLGDSNGGSSQIREQVAQLRQDGDVFWLNAQALILQIQQRNKSKKVLAANLERSSQAFQLFKAARARVDRQIEGGEAEITPGVWIEIATGFISSIAQLRESLLAVVEMPHEVAHLNLTLKHWVWLASEHAGRERAVFAYYVGVRQAVPEKVWDSLMNYRRVVEQELLAVQSVKQQIGLDIRVLDAIGAMESTFLQEFSKLRKLVYRGASDGNYVCSALEWMGKATAAIDSIIAINTAVTEVASERALRVKKQSILHFVVILVLLLLTFMVMVIALLKVRQTTNDLFQQNELAQFTLRSIGDAVVSTDEKGNVRYLNPVAEKMIGWATQEIYGKPLRNYFYIMNGLTRAPEPNPVDVCLQEMRVVGLNDNTILVHKDGKEYAIEDSAAPIRNHDGDAVGAVMVFYESSMAHSKDHLLSYHASHDSLTRLINRREFERHMTELLAHSKNSGEQHALCYLDLDQFKIVNDTCGHVAGDKLLRQVTYLFEEKVRDADVLARLGGDEFGLLLENCTLKKAVHIAEGLRKVVKEFRFIWEDKAFEVSVSIGVVPITADSASPAEILSDADAACFAAKDKGRNCIQVYEPGNIELARRHGEMQWVSRITEALEEDRFILYSQSIMPLNETHPKHVELLIRMLDREGKVIAPMAFIPAAERYNLMLDIDRWVIHSSFAEICRLSSEGHTDNMVFNINLSGASLGVSNLPLFIRSQLGKYDLSPKNICFEITETAAISNFDQAMELMKSLRGIGFMFALDDFGSGLSSFGYLKNMPVDFLKIDGQLIEGIESDPIAYGMVEAIHRVGQIMGIKTIAEYVSSETILEKLRLLGVDYAQGYAISKPQPFVNIGKPCS